jgi:chorismate mutase/catechol 2,3-dioxygenase-like lactoylglutathione lyase family enzyme
VNASTPDPALLALRQRIDDLDRRLIETLAERLEVCHEVARVKETSETPVIQPQRVRDVITSRRQMALDAGVDPDFAEEVIRVLLAETHRIEVAGRRADSAPTKIAGVAAAGGDRDAEIALDTVASRIDHAVIAVTDLVSAIASFASLGFRLADETSTHPGVAVVRAGGVTLVLVSAEASAGVARHLAQHGPGIHHVAVEVLNAGYARAAIDHSSSPLVTDAHGHEQFFTVRDDAMGTQLGFIGRTGHRVGVAGIDVANLLAAFSG